MSTNLSDDNFKTAKEIDDENKEDCSRCIRLHRRKRGKIDFPRSYFCEFCYAELTIGSGEV